MVSCTLRVTVAMALLALTACGGGDKSTADATATGFQAAPLALANTAECESARPAVAMVGENCLKIASQISMGPQSAPLADIVLTPDALFEWAPTIYPQFFRGAYVGGSVLYAGKNFNYRFYAQTQTYVAVAEGGIYVLGPWTGSQLYYVGPLASFACTVYPTSCGGSPPSTLQLAQAFLAAFDSFWGSLPANGTVATEFLDGCYLNGGYTKALSQANSDEDIAKAQAAAAHRVGSTRSNISVLAERNTTNADGSARREIDVQYRVNYPDGSVDDEARETLLMGSSAGSCATPDNLTSMRFFGNRRVVDVLARGKNLRDERYVMASGAVNSTPLTYRREVQLRVMDPAGVATYVVVSGPGPSTVVNGVAMPFSLKLISPRVLRSAPELLGKANNYLNWQDEDNFRACRASSTAVGTGVPVASAADCVGQGAQGPTWGWTLSNPNPSNLSTADAGFAGLGFVAGGSYTFAVYADDGWKTVNGQGGKTPIATYTTTMRRLPYTFVEMAGAGTSSDLFPRVLTTSLTTAQLAATFTAGSASSVALGWSLPGTQADARVFRLSAAYEFFEGPSAATTASFPAYRYSNSVHPASTATSVVLNLSAKPPEISRKSYAEFGLEYSDRNGSLTTSSISFR